MFNNKTNLNEPFVINDRIVSKKFEGTLENIQIRATTIRTYEGTKIVIPNAELFTNNYRLLIWFILSFYWLLIGK
ncbi:mechanosensitive ion channel domain-containing protein [Pleurocapsa sp. FMAR1]|uniref:mechanosensitive ion channel domain-containing protein n=1 Tax=Pleurocapsa sp. FMAR1 TaxID=3040204 RepID=UPI0029C8081A|nr:mechanosensitive ion channel domain-containing protein [Pleurocapsa sp. FMAR1]